MRSMGLSAAICDFVCSAPSRGQQLLRDPGVDRAGTDHVDADLPRQQFPARLRVIERRAALPAAYALSAGMPSMFATEVVSTTPLPSASSGASFCTVK